MLNGNLKLAIQRKGRLADRSIELLKSCGLEIDSYSNRLLISARNFELDLLLLRDDDIPEYVKDGVADIGIVGEDIITESESDVQIIKKLGFGKCKLMIAIPEQSHIANENDLQGKTIATSYPVILNNYLKDKNVNAKVIELSGSVEIAPSLGVADYICDLVSTGTTLKLNKLKKSLPIFDSQAVLIKGNSIDKDSHKLQLLDQLLLRIDSALYARKSKYLKMNVPESAVKNVCKIIPSLKSPTVLPLAENGMVALHAVIPSDTFWKIVDDLKKAGASGILLSPIENIIL